MPDEVDVVVIGAGITGLVAASRIAAARHSVLIVDAGGVASGASGRNAGLIEHPYRPELNALFESSLRIYRGLGIGPSDDVLFLGDQYQAQRCVDRLDFPGLHPTLLSPWQVRLLEREVDRDLWACQVRTGWLVRPVAVAQHYYDSAHRLGATSLLSTQAQLWWDGEQCVGVRVPRKAIRARNAVLVCAGHATGRIIDPTGTRGAVGASWGVSFDVELPNPPAHPLFGADIVGTPSQQPFSLIPKLGGGAVLGSTFLASKPDPEAWRGAMITQGSRFYAPLAEAQISARLACPRPVSADGLPLIGRIRGAERLWAATGGGARGITLGPAVGFAIADAILAGSDSNIAPELRADRVELLAPRR